MSANLTESPASIQMPARFFAPGRLILNAVCWRPGGAIVVGRVGEQQFRLTVPTCDLLDRKRFAFNLWRFKKLLAVQPTIEA